MKGFRGRKNLGVVIFLFLKFSIQFLFQFCSFYYMNRICSIGCTSCSNFKMDIDDHIDVCDNKEAI